jgi:hypothetical protein
MGQPIKLVFEPLRVKEFGSITSSYTAVGTAIEFPFRIIRLFNNTNVSVFFSFDGSTDHEFLSTNSFSLYDLTTNQALMSGAFMPGNTTVYVKDNGTPASAGCVTLTIVRGM